MMFLGEAFALGAAVCWAVGPVVAYAGVARLGTFRFSMLRFLLSALVLGVLAWWTGQFGAADPRALIFLVVSGVLGVALGEACLFQAVFLLGPRIASILFSLHSPVTAFIGARLFNEAVSFRELAGILLAVAGVTTAILFRSAAERSGSGSHKPADLRKGFVLVGMAVVLQVTGALLSKEAVGTVQPFFASFVRTASASAAFFPLFMMFRERRAEIAAGSLKYVAYSAGISTVGGMTFLLAAFANTEISRAVVISSMAPVVYIVLMALFR